MGVAPITGVAIQRVDDLDIDQDLAFERRSRVVESVGIWVMVAVVVAAALGLLGSGPLSAATARTEGLVLDFQRISRYQSSETLSLRVDPAVMRGPEVRVWLDRAYLDGVQLERVVPTPVRTESAPGRVVFVVAVAEPGHPLTLTFSLQPSRLGLLRGRVGLDATAGGAVAFRQLVLP
jgi:hypothetical protein